MTFEIESSGKLHSYAEDLFIQYKVKDEMVTFIGEMPMFRYLDDYLPKQKGKIIEHLDNDGFNCDISNLYFLITTVGTDRNSIFPEQHQKVVIRV